MPKEYDNHPDKRPNRELTYEERIPAAILRLLTTSLATLHFQFDPSKVGAARGEAWFLDVDSPDGVRHMATQASLDQFTSTFKVAWWQEGKFGKQGSYQVDLYRPTGAYTFASNVADTPISQLTNNNGGDRAVLNG